MSEWISVEDRLPAYKKDMGDLEYKETDVIVHTASGEVYQAIFNQGTNGGYWSDFSCIDAPVLHWMPLPEPPPRNEEEAMSYTKQEFKEAMALLDGFEDVSARFGCKKFKKGDHVGGASSLPDYYNDLNYLMPLAWKNNIVTVIDMGIADPVWTVYQEYKETPNYYMSHDAAQAIRDCLFELSQERKA